MAVTVHETGYGKGKVIAIIIAVILVLCMVGVGVVLKDTSGVSVAEGEEEITVSTGEGIESVANNLAKANIIKFPIIFRLQSKLGGYDVGLQPGIAVIKNGMSYKDILELLITQNRGATKITIPEGYEVKQIAQKLDEAGVVSWQDFYAALNPGDYNYDFLQNLPQRDGQMEGYLFPATYEIPQGMSAHDIIDLMLEAFDTQFTDEFRTRTTELGMTIDEVITMASIVEREAENNDEMAKVAGVFYNRRNSGMKFQSCATVQYILGDRKPVLSIADTQIDSPYNTYMYPGFPVGPIANPGIDSIKAALYPEETDAYYFVMGKDGSHIFSNTYEEHLNAMQNSNPTMSVDSSAIENQDSMKAW